MAEQDVTGEALEGQEFVLPSKRKVAQSTGNQETASQEKPSTEGKTPPDKEHGVKPQIEHGTVEAKSLHERLGYRSEEELERATKEKNAKITEQGQELAKIRENLAYQQGLIESLTPKNKEPEMTDEQWNNLFNENPAEFMRLRDERLVNSILQNPTISETVNLTRKSQANIMLSDLRSKHGDFIEYEHAIARELEAMGPDAVLMAKSPESLERIYRMLRAEKHAEIVKGQEERLSQATEQVNQGVQKFANIGANSMNAAMPTNAGGSEPPKTVRTRVGDLTTDDMEFVISPQTKIIR